MELNEEVVLKSGNNIAGLFSKRKDRDDKFKRSNLVFKILCGACEKYYIGQTS